MHQALCIYCHESEPLHDPLANGLLCPRQSGGNGETFTPPAWDFAGKWQRRIYHVLYDAGLPLTTRQLRIRCGMTPQMDPSGNFMRNTLRTMRLSSYLQSPRPGIWHLWKQGVTR